MHTACACKCLTRHAALTRPPPTPPRDGTVYSAVTPAALSNPEALYRKLGAKLVVGMPFKDIATSGAAGRRHFFWGGAGLQGCQAASAKGGVFCR